MTDRERLRDFDTVSRLYRLVARVSRAVCRHPEGTICPHRQYEYDIWLRGYGAGFTAGSANMEAKWLGSLNHDGPYANYPPPQQPRPVLAALRPEKP